MASLTINYKNMPKGVLIEVSGFGMFKNGTVNDVERLDEDLVLGEAEGAESPDDVEEFKAEADPPVKEDPQPASTEPEPEVPAVGAELKAEPEEMATPGRKTKKKDGE